jgi:hypothetical protein
MADPFDFDLPANWGYFVPEPLPLHSTFNHDSDVVEEWFRVPHAKLLEAAQRKSGGMPSVPQPSKAAVAAAVMKEVREGAYCSSKGKSRAASSPGRGNRGGSGPSAKSEPENDPIQAMLAEHNKKFKKVTYEPRQHSVKDVKQVASCALARVRACKAVSLSVQRVRVRDAVGGSLWQKIL